MTFIKPARLAVGAIAAAFALSACGPGLDEADRQTRSEGDVRLVNATDDRPSLDLFNSDSAVQTGVVPNAASSYGRISTGSATLGVRATGNAATLTSITTSIGNGDHRTLVAASSAGTLAITLLGDDESKPDRNSAKLRILHTAAAEAGAVDVFVAASCTGLPASATAVATSVSGLSSYVQVAASAAGHVCVTRAGDRADLRLDAASLTLPDQRIVTLILTRTAASTQLKGLVLDQQRAPTTATAP